MADFTPVTLVKGDIERVVTSAVEHTRLVFAGFTEKPESEPGPALVAAPEPRPVAAPTWRPQVPPQAAGRL